MGPLNWDTKDMLWIDDHNLIMSYESLAVGFLTPLILNTILSHQRWLCGQDGIVPLGIWGDWLKEYDTIKSLVKEVNISEEFSMIFSTHQY